MEPFADENAATALTSQDFLGMGLEIAGHSKWEQYKLDRNVERFKVAFGVIPETCASIWQDLRRREKINKQSDPRHFLIGVRFLWKYEEEADLARFFGIRTHQTVRKWWKIYVQIIESLLDEKVVSKKVMSWSLLLRTVTDDSLSVILLQMGTLEENDEGFIFMLSVDGIHCPIHEPRPLSVDWSSHKYGGKPGVNYEVGLLIHKPKLVWVNGYTKPGKVTDLCVFRDKLLPALASLPADRKVIADGIYAPEPDFVSFKNDLDPQEIRHFKNRVCARHENFNGFLKQWGVLKTKFRHRVELHSTCFRAVCTIAMHQIDTGGYSLLDPYP